MTPHSWRNVALDRHDLGAGLCLVALVLSLILLGYMMG